MKRGEMGRYETTRIAGESVRAFAPHPLPPDPSVVLDASLQQALESAEAALADLNQALETSDRPTISPRPSSPPRSCSLLSDRGHLSFFDGNARTDRNLIVWQLCQAGAIGAPFLPPSTYFKQQPQHQKGASRMSSSKAIHAVDLFSGVGGLTKGLTQAGIKVKAGFDIDESCRYAYETNNREAEFTAADIRDISFADIAPYYEGADIKVLVGCAPCQPFSAYTRKASTSNTSDCSLIGEFARLIEEGEPDIVSMENVVGLRQHSAFKDFKNTLEALGYASDYGVLSCADYGVPQTRKRLVLVASKLGDISLPPPSSQRTSVADFIKNLPSLEDGETDPKDHTHTTLKLSDRNKQRIQQSHPGGSWKDWEKDIVSQCHSKAHYPASYGRMRWDKPAPTITTQFCYYSTGRFGHPEQDRTISLREAAMLQTFPKTYQFSRKRDAISPHIMARHIGNAVPVKLGKAIGQSVVEASNVK